MWDSGGRVLGAIALLLWGTHMVTSGMLRGFAGALRVRLGAALKDSRRAFAAGILTTLGLQSSTATGLMAASFLQHGLFGLTTGLVMMLGANVGTALVAKLLSFPIVHLVPWLLAGGVWAFRHARGTRGRSLGRVAIGLALMLWALHDLGEAAVPLAQGPVAQAILNSLEGQVLAPLIVGAVAAWALHASVAVVLVVATLMSAGTLPLLGGLAMVLGANLGGALGPYLETQGAVARRLPLGNLLARGVAVALVAPLLPVLAPLIAQVPWSVHKAVDFHVAFNLLAAAMAWPFSTRLAVWLKHLLPDPPALSDPAKPEYLDPELVTHADLALVAAERECVRLGGQAEAILREIEPILLDPSPLRAERVEEHADAASRLAQEIRRYLGKVEQSGMGAPEVRRSQELHAFALGAEQALDTIKDLARDRREGATPVSAFLDPLQRGSCAQAHHLVLAASRDAIAVLMTGNVETARALVASRDDFRAIERDALRQQLVQRDQPGTIQATDVWVHTLQDLRRVHSQWSSVAHQVLEHAGLLRGRLREVAPPSGPSPLP